MQHDLIDLDGDTTLEAALEKAVSEPKFIAALEKSGIIPDCEAVVEELKAALADPTYRVAIVDALIGSLLAAQLVQGKR